MKIKPAYIILLAITVIAAAFRFYHLDYNSLWLDEAATLYFANQGYMGVWNSVLSGEYNPPLFYWVEVFMLNFGRSEFILRLVPCITGILTIPALYLLGKEWRNDTVGLIAAALLAFAPFHIYYSQEARAYTFAVLFVILLLWSYIVARKTNSYKWWIVVAAFAALGFWSHFYTAIVFGLALAYTLLESRFSKEQIKRVLVAIVAYIWFTLPLLLAMGFLVGLRTREAPSFGIQGPAILTDLFWNYGSCIWYVSAVMFVLMLVGFALLWRSNRDKFWFAAVVVAGCLLITVPLSYKIPMVSRYLLYLLPMILLIVAEPLAYFKDKRLIALFTIGFIVLGMPTLTTYYSNYVKNDWRGYGEFLGNTLEQGDVIICMPAYMNLPQDYYYNATEHGVTLRKASNVTELEWYSVKGKTYYTMTPDIGVVDQKLETVKWLKENAQYVGQWEQYIYMYRM